ncbi:hypothetical protein [Streptomyces sp. NBC_00576]|uniref:hypothetical protein n=1 Tax=Streptomyces sp. NBC_00576 TaxID=2903665 RepID=UPI002E80DC09|nr:hypothetical protein [Streptomyces sp. NBC_00576]WUB72288.1 hypothetical protein OG734_20430 [Streptomyces sp. NBC_00576]
MTGVTTAARCGRVRASMFSRAPIFSEAGACVRDEGHKGYHRDARGGMWDVRPIRFESNAENGVPE